MSPTPTDRLRQEVHSNYETSDFPALYALGRQGLQTRPLAGLRVLLAFPTWPNTLALYLVLLESGAELVFTPGHLMPHDAATVARLPELNVNVTQNPAAAAPDIVLDCGGVLAGVESRLGYVELTRSGVPAYRNCALPVFLVDAGAIKLIENSLGTGDGFVRGLAQYGFSAIGDRSLVVFGGGKVGQGIARRCAEEGARVTVIDHHRPASVDLAVRYVDARDKQAVRNALRSAWCVVTATGEPGAAGPFSGDLLAHEVILTNMGVEDEYGPDVPADRVLNGKKPLNFCLTEPTRLRYLDPSFALAAAGAVELARGDLPPGINIPDPRLEELIMEPVRTHGAIAGELLEAGL